jgi:ribosomal protein L32
MLMFTTIVGGKMHFTNTNNPIDFPPCGCYNCMRWRKDENGWPLTLSTFIVCPNCGNKRCPKATDHMLECTNSNEPGQKGSRYE